MSVLDTARAPPKRRKSKSKSKPKPKPISQAEAERRQRQRETSHRIPRVIPWLEWVKLRGISLSTAERLEKAGKVKVTRMSPRRKGVREDHDQEYLDSCVCEGRDPPEAT
jgi:hypothetical protein